MVRSETHPKYQAREQGDDAIIARAIQILESRLKTPGAVIDSPDAARSLLRLRLTEREHEVFAVLFCDNKHRVIAYEEMFRGTIDGASVHPREVVKTAMKRNAAAVVLAHNHPSGDPEPSQADIRITQRLKDALALINVRILDHMIVGHADVISFAEKRLL